MIEKHEHLECEWHGENITKLQTKVHQLEKDVKHLLARANTQELLIEDLQRQIINARWK